MRLYLDSTVAGDDLACPSQEIFDSLPVRLTANPEFKIIWPVVRAVAVLVVDALVVVEGTAEHPLHNDPVFKPPVVWSCSLENVPIVVEGVRSGDPESSGLWATNALLAFENCKLSLSDGPAVVGVAETPTLHLTSTAGFDAYVHEGVS